MNKLSATMSEKNLEILNAIKKEELSVREISERIGCSPGKITQATKIFKKFAIINILKRKNRIFLRPNYKNLFYQRIMSLSNIHKILQTKSYLKLEKIGTIGIYGSYAKGTDDAESDIDLIIRTEKKEIELRNVIRKLSEELKMSVNPLILTKKKFDNVKTKDIEFYNRMQNELIVLNGETIE